MADNEKEWPVIGIDLGTTNSCVAIWQNDIIKIITNDQGNRTTPSCVAFKNSERHIGDGALLQAIRNPENTIFDVKRLIGKRINDANVQSDIDSWPFEVIARPGDADGKPVVKVSCTDGDKHLSPEEISSMILVKMKEIAEDHLGTIVKKAVITVPAYFNDSQRQATKDAGEIAGLEVMRIINEPTAAVYAYGLEKKISSRGVKRNVLVFDLGGGTFDVSIVCMEKNLFEVKSVGGDTHLGGVDFNRRMMEHFVEEFKRLHKIDIGRDPKSLGKLRKACEEAKRTLSTNLEAPIEIDSLYDGIYFSSSITRATFEYLNMNLFNKIIEPIEQCLKDAKLEKSNVDDIVLVGGSTRIPQIQKLLRELFDGKELCRQINPDEAVAHGAAAYAAFIAGVSDKKDIVLRDVAPLSLGVELDGGEMKIVIPRNTTIPTRKVTKITTCVDNQTEMGYPVYEGERPQAIHNNYLGTFVLLGIPPADKGVPKFDVWFDIDANGILTASAEDVNTGNKSQITVTNRSRFSKEEVDRLIEEAKMNKVEEERFKRKVLAKNALQNYAYKTLTTVCECGPRLKMKDRIIIQDEINNALDWPSWNDHLTDASKIQKRLKDLQDFCDPIIVGSSKSLIEQGISFVNRPFRKPNSQEEVKKWGKGILYEEVTNDSEMTRKEIEDARKGVEAIREEVDAKMENLDKTVDEKVAEILKAQGLSPNIASSSNSSVSGSSHKPNYSQNEKVKMWKRIIQEQVINDSKVTRKEVEDPTEEVEAVREAVDEKMANLDGVMGNILAKLKAQQLGTSNEVTKKGVATTRTGIEIREEISKIPGIPTDKLFILKALKIFMGRPVEFEKLKGLPDDEKLEWVLLYVNEG